MQDCKKSTTQKTPVFREAAPCNVILAKCEADITQVEAKKENFVWFSKKNEKSMTVDYSDQKNLFGEFHGDVSELLEIEKSSSACSNMFVDLVEKEFPFDKT